MTIVQVDEWLRLAGLAPSALNTQPWRFRVTPAAIDLFADPARALPVSDPQGRERAIACGCALLNLRAAGAADSCVETIDLLPDPAAPDHLARVRLEDGPADAALAALAPAIELRRSTRHAFEPGSFPAALRDQLAAAAAAEGATLRWVDARPERQRLADLVAEADRRLRRDPAYRHELAHWIHPGRSVDGLPASRIVGRGLRFLVDHLDLGRTAAARDEVYALHAPALALLATPGDTPADWLAAGQALERLLLRAALDGIHAGYLNQPCQLPDLREQLADAVTPGLFPQLCLRLGRPAQPPPPQRRRPV
uniref:Acg family FMN-binding oxidoreductase n=1 Tax=Tepidiforma sp. TaxID=2682230 RepID=UPI002ADD636E